jgi:hypothetical protein
LCSEGVEGERPEEIATHPALNLIETAGGVFDPLKGEEGVEAFEFGAEVGVAEELGCARAQEKKVFEKKRERAEEDRGLLLAFSSGAIGLGHLEEGGVVGILRCVADKQERVGAGGDVGFEIEAKGFACGSLGEAGDESALLLRDVGAPVGKKHLDLFYGQCAETDRGTAGADGGEEFAGVFGEEDEVDGGGGFFEDFEEGVGGLLHEGGGGEDEDFLWGFGGEVVGALDESADLAEFDEELRRVGRDDEDVGVGLNEDAGVFLVDFAELFADGYGFVDLFVEVGGRGDAGAVVADATEAGEGLAVGPEVAWLTFALDGHGEHEGEGVFSCSGGAGEDEGVGEAAGGDGGAEMFDGGGVAEEVVEGGG